MLFLVCRARQQQCFKGGGHPVRPGFSRSDGHHHHPPAPPRCLQPHAASAHPVRRRPHGLLRCCCLHSFIPSFLPSFLPLCVKFFHHSLLVHPCNHQNIPSIYPASQPLIHQCICPCIQSSIHPLHHSFIVWFLLRSVKCSPSAPCMRSCTDVLQIHLGVPLLHLSSDALAAQHQQPWSVGHAHQHIKFLLQDQSTNFFTVHSE